ncbi:hypothetical protein A7U60_g8517 [Sanghuangporus baumii]|uniref:MARVEL domain-containing protein n=1 Tax=Sanghuangporus baumii TaxID=108892 RepID=A0A9Q5HRD0_SANBA|nr:hypothetical protein A7U60_g8517 [Sanghuangporus baumii]
MAPQNFLWLARIGIFGAAYIAKLDDLGFSSPDFAGLAVAISVITLIVITPMLAIDFVRRGAVTSWVIVELGVTGVLMILWLATAATTADFTDGTVDCDGLRGDSEFICRTYQAIEAFAFINWLLLLFYFSALIGFSVTAQVRRNPPWRGTVRDTDFLARNPTPVVVPMAQQPMYPAKRNSFPAVSLQVVDDDRVALVKGPPGWYKVTTDERTGYPLIGFCSYTPTSVLSLLPSILSLYFYFAMAVLWIIRTDAPYLDVVIVILSSCAVAGLGGNYLAKYLSFGENPNIPGILDGSTLPWVCLSIAAAGLSVLLVTPMLIIDFMRRGAVTSWVVIELVVFSIISVVWLAGAAIAAAGFDLNWLTAYTFPKSCKGLDELITSLEALAVSDPQQYGEFLDVDLDSFGTLCRSHQAIEALGFLSWIILMGYAITLLISALVAKKRGHPAIWSSTVRDTRFLARHDEQPYYREEIDVPMAAMQQDYYASNPNLKMETATLVSDSAMHAQNVHQ